MFNLRSIYRDHTAAHRFIIGFENKHERRIYAVVVTWEQLAPFIVDDMTAADEDGERYPCIRYKIQRGQRDKLEAGLLPSCRPYEFSCCLAKTYRICTAEHLRNYAKAHKLNLGEAFEDIACDALGLRQNRNRTEAWYEGPDAWTEDGEPLQIGYEGKTFTYTAQVERMGWA